MQRLLEAGAYRNKEDLESKIVEEPLLDAVMKSVIQIPVAPGIIGQTESPPARFREYASLTAIERHISARILELDIVDELTRTTNGLDEWIKNRYDIINFSIKQHNAYSGYKLYCHNSIQNEHCAV